MQLMMMASDVQDVAIFLTNDYVNGHNCRIFDQERNLVRDCPKVKYCVTKWLIVLQRLSFFFAENTITANIYLHMLHMFAFPQIEGTEE